MADLRVHSPFEDLPIHDHATAYACTNSDITDIIVAHCRAKLMLSIHSCVDIRIEVYVDILCELRFYPINQIEPRPSCLRRVDICLLYTSPSPRDRTRSRMPSSA